MEGARVSLLGAQMPGPDPTPTSGRVLLGAPPSSSMFLNCPSPGRLQPVWSPAVGTSPQGSQGWTRGLLGRAREGLGGGPERKAPSADWNKVAALGAQPGFIDLAWCSSHRAGPAPGRLPVFPGVGTPWGNGFSCGSGVGLPPSTWGRPGRWGHASSGGAGDLESHSQQMSGSWRPGWGLRAQAPRTLGSLSSEPAFV